MWFIESAGYRIGPDWYTEAGPFETARGASDWLEKNHSKLDTDVLQIRIRLYKD
jgi:hypothetical protein